YPDAWPLPAPAAELSVSHVECSPPSCPADIVDKAYANGPLADEDWRDYESRSAPAFLPGEPDIAQPPPSSRAQHPNPHPAATSWTQAGTPSHHRLSSGVSPATHR